LRLGRAITAGASLIRHVRASALSGERQIRICPWGKLPACQIRKLEAHATVRTQLPLALALIARARPARFLARPFDGTGARW
jgi:hypothetical protein